MPKVSQVKLDKITTIARQVRKEVVKRNKLIGMFEKNLCGLCAIASAKLFDELRQNGFRPWLVRTGCHTFIECLGHVVDITATQFGNRTICILPKPKTVQAWYWNPEHVVGKARSKRSWKKLFSDWENSQHPLNSEFWTTQDY